MLWSDGCDLNEHKGSVTAHLPCWGLGSVQSNGGVIFRKSSSREVAVSRGDGRLPVHTLRYNDVDVESVNMQLSRYSRAVRVCTCENIFLLPQLRSPGDNQSVEKSVYLFIHPIFIYLPINLSIYLSIFLTTNSQTAHLILPDSWVVEESWIWEKRGTGWRSLFKRFNFNGLKVNQISVV